MAKRKTAAPAQKRSPQHIQTASAEYQRTGSATKEPRQNKEGTKKKGQDEE